MKTIQCIKMEEIKEVNELCGMYKINYYDKCKDCTGRDISKLCYITQEQVKKHLEEFYNRFELAENLLEKRFD